MVIHFILRASKTFFQKFPLTANCITYGTLYVGAELSQQVVTKKIFANPSDEIDKAAVGRYAIMGTFVYSPILYSWYKWLDLKLVGTTKGIITKKLLMDQFILTPVLLVIFFTGMSFMEQKHDILEECYQKFVPSFQKSCLFWLPAQTLNFMYIQPRFRVIYVGTCSFLWINMLCWIKRQQNISEIKGH